MKALVYEAPNQAAVKEMDPPPIGENDVLVRTRAVGICHSDFDLLSGNYILPVEFPVTPGHEWTGEVAEIGSAVMGFAPGDRVVGECSVADDEHFGFTVSGAAADYFRVPAAWLHHLPASLDDTMGALVEPFTVAYAATSGIDASDDVVIFGAGPIGLCSVAAAVGKGGRVIMVEPNEERRAIAVSLGATATLDPTSGDLLDAVAEHTSGRMASKVIEASGNPRAMADTLEVAGYGAHLTNVGINVGDSASARLGLVVAKALHIRGQVGSVGVWPAAIRFLGRIDADLSSLVSARFPLSQAVEALHAAEDREKNIKIHIVAD